MGFDPGVFGMAKRLLFDFRLMFRYPNEVSADVARDLLGTTLAPGVEPHEYWLRRALGHYLLARFDDALRALGLALSHDAASGEAHYLRGVCLQLLALEAAQRDPTFPLVLSPEAKQRFELARDAFLRALELNPDDDESRQMVVGLRFLLGEAEPGDEASLPETTDP